MHGLKGGGWKRKRPGHGHHRWDDLAGNRRNADPGTYHRLAPPRLPPTLLHHGASSRTFGYLDHFAFWRVVGWLRKRHPRTHHAHPGPAVSARMADPRRRDRP